MSNGNGEKRNEILGKIRNSINKLVTLEIITTVGDVKPPANKDESVDIDWGKNPKVILTKIDLLQGDIKTVCHPDLLTDEYQGIRDLHKDQKQKGIEIIDKNIDTLKKLYNAIRDEFN